MAKELLDLLVERTGLDRAVLEKNLVRSKEVTLGDLSLPCFLLAKAWKCSPPDAAARLKGELGSLPAGISKVEAVGPYLNFFFDRAAFASREIEKILAAGFEAGRGAPREETVIVEYASLNIAKPLHIGHFRNTSIGSALDRIHRHLGYKVVSINHLGDWGTQFGYVYVGCQLWGRPENPDVEGLVDLYKRASALRKAQEENLVPEADRDKPNVFEMAKEYFRRLEAGEPEAVKFWEWCCDTSLSYFKQIDERLGIRFDHYTGESFYRSMLGEVEKMVRDSGILEESRGALGVDLGKKLGFVRIFAEDGRSLYITRDIAAAEYRIRTFNPDRMLYVVGAPQTLHFQQLKAVLERMRHPASSKIVHVPYGHVPGISSRGSSGDSDRISLHGLLDEAHERALEVYRNQVTKRPEGLDEERVAECVGQGAVFFNYLCRGNIKDFHFNWDEALNFQGDTGPYIQYALARLYSIEAKARESGITAGPGFDASVLADDRSYELVSLLARFGETLEKVAAEHEPYHLANYLLDLAKSLSGVYKDLRVVGEEPGLARARLALFVACKNVLYAGMSLIGVPPIERM